MLDNSKTCLFDAHTIAQHAQSIADYLPDGKLWQSKNLQNSNFRNLLLGLAYEFQRFETNLIDYACEYDLNTTTLFITQWEQAVGIPDDCFPATGTIEERRAHVKAKLAAINAITIADLIEIANILGFSVEIQSLEDEAGFPLTFPYTFITSSKEAKFTIIVEFLDIIDTGVFPYTLPLTFNDGAKIENFLTCFFRKIVPANVALDFRFQIPPVIPTSFIFDDGSLMATDSGDIYVLD